MPASDKYLALSGALKERLALIADRDFYHRDPAAHLAQLREVSEKIAACAAQLAADTDPRLTHYLQRSSYDKALAFLEEAVR